MLVSRADACSYDGKQRRETWRDVAMFCESYCLKDGDQQPEKNRTKYHKQNGIEHGLVPSDVAALEEPPGRGITGFVGITARSEIGGTC